MEKTRDKAEAYKVKIVWRNVILMGLIHLVGIYAATQVHRCKWQSALFVFFMVFLSALGITAGAHRLWSHRTYKAKLPLRIFLAVLNSCAGQNSIFEWSRDHRVHHKFSETDADPHNAKRGFFFSHVGWLLVRKHPDVINKGKTVDLDDLLRDPVVRWQHRYYLPSAIFMMLVFPTVIPVMCWGEGWFYAYILCFLRYIWLLNATWSVNSAAHMWGYKPYDKSINPAENRLVSLFTYGEGFHNYHHTFPYDYATSEFGNLLNSSKVFIEFMEKIGLAYDLRKVSPEVLKARKCRTGDTN